MTLEDFFLQHRRVAIAFSGGVDSSYLLYTAKKYAEEVRAYYVKSAFQPAFEFDDAKRLARELDINLCIIPIDVLTNEKVVANPANRCYYCKQVIFTKIISQAAQDGFTELLDGTNASDDSGDRPGMKALEELKVMSPLRQCGLTKQMLDNRSGNPDTAPLAKIEITEDQLPLFIEKRQEILSKLKNDYSKVLLDLEMRNEK